MNIIGINGFKRSGKGETGRAIDNLLLGVKLLGFADKLKVFAARSLGFLLSDADCIALMDRAKEEWILDIIDQDQGLAAEQYVKEWSVRKLLQYMGTEARTVFGDDFWVDQVLPVPAGYNSLSRSLVQERYPGVETLVFTDLRFPNEAQRIIDLGGFNIEVIRPGTGSDGHASEQKLPDELIRYQINNSGTLMELQWEVEKVLELAGLKQ